jgi:hypothetical protein
VAAGSVFGLLATLALAPASRAVGAGLRGRQRAQAGVAGVYNRATYMPEKTGALALWAEHVQSIVTGKPAKVVQLRDGDSMTSAPPRASGGHW